MITISRGYSSRMRSVTSRCGITACGSRLVVVARAAGLGKSLAISSKGIALLRVPMNVPKKHHRIEHVHCGGIVLISSPQGRGKPQRADIKFPHRFKRNRVVGQCASLYKLGRILVLDEGGPRKMHKVGSLAHMQGEIHHRTGEVFFAGNAE